MITEISEPSTKENSICNSIRQFVDYRYGFAFVVLLSGWVMLTLLFAPQSIAANAMRLENYLQLFLVALFNFMASVFAISLMRILAHRFPPTKRFASFLNLFGNGDQPWSRLQFLIAILIALPTPILLASAYGSELSNGEVSDSNTIDYVRLFYSMGTIIASFFVSWGVLLFIGFLKTFLFGSQKDLSNFLPFEDVDRPGAFSSIVTWIKNALRDTQIEEIDIQLGIYVTLLAVLHFSTTRFLEGFLEQGVSVPLVIVVILWISFLFFAGLAYWLDKIRVPVVLALLAFILISNLFFDRSYTLKTLSDKSGSLSSKIVHDMVQAEGNAVAYNRNREDTVKKESEPLEESAWGIVSKRRELFESKYKTGNRVAVVVTCPGGGIHAAAWSTYVLETLCEKYPRFRDSICVISGVSGGSVGALFFVTKSYSDAFPESKPSDSLSAFELATESSLEEIAVGLMTDDLYGAIIPPLRRIDRGQRLENALLSRLPTDVRNHTLNGWGETAKAGRLPIVIFNATDAVTGRRILFDSVPTPIRKSNIGQTSRPFNYRELLASISDPIDISPTTAVRASASFPYVSTFTSMENGSDFGVNVAIGDGGYVDNEGLVTALDWILFLLETNGNQKDSKERAFDQILLLRIVPEGNSDSLEPPTSTWLTKNLRWLAGPVETIANARATSQSERGSLETDLANAALPKSLVSSPTYLKRIFQNTFGWSSTKSETKTQKPATRNKENAANARFSKWLKETPSEKWNKLKKELESNPPSSIQTIQKVQAAITDSPVIVMELPFETPDKSNIIPLNWKLTKEQKTWYSNAWKRIETDQAEDIETLDALFAN